MIQTFLIGLGVAWIVFVTAAAWVFMDIAEFQRKIRAQDAVLKSRLNARQAKIRMAQNWRGHFHE
jgi:hypothetical protein